MASNSVMIVRASFLTSWDYLRRFFTDGTRSAWG